MNRKEHINQLIDETIDSVDIIQRAKPGPFLLTRINARLANAKETLWEKASWFIARPIVAIPGLIMLILVNVAVIVFNRHTPFTVATEQQGQAASDEFSYASAGIYDIENTEP